MNSPEKLSSARTTPNKQVRGADRPSDHRGWPPEQPWLKVRTGVAKSPDTCGSHAGIYTSDHHQETTGLTMHILCSIIVVQRRLEHGFQHDFSH